jgi:hypothetical protein
VCAQEEVKLKQQLAEPLHQLQETARAIAQVQRECKLDVDPEQYVESFTPYLMDVSYAWSKVRSPVLARPRPPACVRRLSCSGWRLEHGWSDMFLRGRRH